MVSESLFPLQKEQRLTEAIQPICGLSGHLTPLVG